MIKPKAWTVPEGLRHYAEKLEFGGTLFELVQALSPEQRAFFDEFMGHLDVHTNKIKANELRTAAANMRLFPDPEGTAEYWASKLDTRADLIESRGK